PGSAGCHAPADLARVRFERPGATAGPWRSGPPARCAATRIQKREVPLQDHGYRLARAYWQRVGLHFSGVGIFLVRGDLRPALSYLRRLSYRPAAAPFPQTSRYAPRGLGQIFQVVAAKGRRRRRRKFSTLDSDDWEKETFRGRR